MGTRLLLECNGCDRTIQSRTLRRTFKSFSGKSWGLGTYVEDTIESVQPEGWQIWDPATQLTYCPTCWEEITRDEPLA